jgi:hypothetical protein
MMIDEEGALSKGVNDSGRHIHRGDMSDKNLHIAAEAFRTARDSGESGDRKKHSGYHDRNELRERYNTIEIGVGWPFRHFTTEDSDEETEIADEDVWERGLPGETTDDFEIPALESDYDSDASVDEGEDTPLG